MKLTAAATLGIRHSSPAPRCQEQVTRLMCEIEYRGYPCYLALIIKLRIPDTVVHVLMMSKAARLFIVPGIYHQPQDANNRYLGLCMGIKLPLSLVPGSHSYKDAKNSFFFMCFDPLLCYPLYPALIFNPKVAKIS